LSGKPAANSSTYSTQLRGLAAKAGKAAHIIPKRKQHLKPEDKQGNLYTYDYVKPGFVNRKSS
jgi:hypothetical protein